MTCDVAAHNLVFSDNELTGFDSNFKVSPPLRTKKDIKALLKGLKEGVIDAVVSQHTPHEIEFKAVEFQIAANGMTGLQTVLPMLVAAGLNDEQIVEKLTVGPRRVVGVEVPTLEVGQPANIVVFDRDKKWTFDKTANKSKGQNNPWFGRELTGKALFVFNNNQLYINE